MGDEQPKIVVDSDWKSEARAEKEKLAAKEREASAAAPDGAEGGDADGAGGARDIAGRPAEFRDLLDMLVMEAVMSMGGMADPKTGRAMIMPERAKFAVDMLGVVEDKTKGNLSEEESATLTRVLHELRLQYVEVAKLVEAEIAKQGGAAGAGGSPISGS